MCNVYVYSPSALVDDMEVGGDSVYSPTFDGVDLMDDDLLQVNTQGTYKYTLYKHALLHVIRASFMFAMSRLNCI